MGKEKAIGSGLEASIFGPYSAETIRKFGFDSDDLHQKKRYVLKIYSKYSTNMKQQIGKQVLSDILGKDVINDSIIFPIQTTYKKGSDLDIFFELPSIKRDRKYMVEIQPYGGHDFFNLMFERKPRKIFTMKQFLKIWLSMADILEDVHPIIFKHHCIITDVKMENMVLSSNYKLRLIDIQITPEISNKFRIFTGDILRTPTQYFHKTWWVKDPLNHINNYRYETSDILSRYRSPELQHIISFIHGGGQTVEQWIDQFSVKPAQLSKTQKEAHKWFFVVYPILMAAICIIYSGCIRISNYKQMKDILVFCINELKARGRSSAIGNNFTQFLRKMRYLGSDDYK